MRYQLVVTKYIVFSILILLLFFSCKQESYNHKVIEKQANHHEKNYTVEIGNSAANTIYEVTLKCINKNNFSKDSFEVISSKLISDVAISSFDLTESRLGYQLNFGNSFNYTLKYPDESTSHQRSLKTAASKCNNLLNELVRITYDADTIDQHRYAKVIGYSTLNVTEGPKFDWESILSNNENLYHIYKQNWDCDHSWKFALEN